MDLKILAIILLIIAFLLGFGSDANYINGMVG